MTTDSTKKKGLLENPITLTLISLATFGLLLWTVIYLGNHFETLENRLQYQPPQVRKATENDMVIDSANRQQVYVPVYSHIYAKGGIPHPLETTLSIRNVERSQSIRVHSVNYYDSQGTIVKEYLDGVLEVAPLQTSEFLVPALDHSGGSGANFVVSWSAEAPVQKPIIEAVMVGVDRAYQISFLSQGRVLTTRSDETNTGTSHE